MIPAFRGELGHKVMFHAPWVYAKGPGHVVEIEEGDEALYPLAKEWRVVPRAADSERRRPAKLSGPFKRFVPEPHVRQNVGAPGVVICPRKRDYGARKNWFGWHLLASEIPYVFAAGAPDSSDTEVDCESAWHYKRFLDATIEAMRSAWLVVATDAGLAHLAVMCGAPLLLVTYRGLTAPGPQVDANGRIMKPNYGSVDLERYINGYETTNIELFDGWERPHEVLERALQVVA